MVLVRRFVFAVFILSLAAGGCTTAWIQEVRFAPTGLAPQDAIAVILTSPLEEERLSELENEVTGCIQDALGQTHSDFRTVPSDELRKLASPDRTTEKIPLGGFSWETLAADPAFYGRIAPLGLRYLIAVNTTEGSRLTDFEWAGGSKVLGAPGPLLHWSWERSSLMEAVVLDTRHRRVAGAVQAYASGKSEAGLMLLIFPIPLPVPYVTPSFPQSVACRGLGEGLAKFLAGETPAEEQAPKQREN